MNTLDQAVTAIRAGDYASGRRLLVDLIRTDPNNERAWLWMASVVEGKKRIQALERVLSINPDNEEALRRLQLLSLLDEPEPPVEKFDLAPGASRLEPLEREENRIAVPAAAAAYPAPAVAQVPAAADSTDVISMIIEIVFGLFGALGVGWLYAGNLATGVAASVGYLLLLLAEGVGIIMTGGILACLVAPLNLVIVAVSGVKVRDYVRKTGARGHVVYPILALILPFILACGTIALLTVMGPSIEAVFDEVVRELEAAP